MPQDEKENNDGNGTDEITEETVASTETSDGAGESTVVNGGIHRSDVQPSTQDLRDKPKLENRDQAENWLKDLFTGLVNLKIQTIVTSSTDQNAQAIRTTINLVDGDIINEINKSLVKDLDVFEFHKEQVNRGEAIIERNVNTVRALAEGLIDLFTG